MSSLANWLGMVFFGPPATLSFVEEIRFRRARGRNLRARTKPSRRLILRPRRGLSFEGDRPRRLCGNSPRSVRAMQSVSALIGFAFEHREDSNRGPKRARASDFRAALCCRTACGVRAHQLPQLTGAARCAGFQTVPPVRPRPSLDLPAPAHLPYRPAKAFVAEGLRG